MYVIGEESSYLSSPNFVAFTTIVPIFFNVITGDVLSSMEAYSEPVVISYIICPVPLPPDASLLNVPSVIAASSGVSISNWSIFWDAFLISIVYCALTSLYLSSAALVASTITLPAFNKCNVPSLSTVA